MAPPSKNPPGAVDSGAGGQDNLLPHTLPTVRTYGQYCPVARGAEVLADRWTPLVLRELGLGATRFNDIARGLPRISRTLLASRVRRLVESGVVEQSDGGYRLTEAGEALREVVDQLGRWAATYSLGEPEADELDPFLLVWWIHRGIDVSRVPERRVTIEFRFYELGRADDLWLTIESSQCSVGRSKPSHKVDLIVESDLAVFYEVWLGRRSLESAIQDQTLVLNGSSELQSAFPHWLELSPFAPNVRAGLALSPVS